MSVSDETVFIIGLIVLVLGECLLLSFIIMHRLRSIEGLLLEMSALVRERRQIQEVIHHFVRGELTSTISRPQTDRKDS